jgi:hypothetical protein
MNLPFDHPFTQFLVENVIDIQSVQSICFIDNKVGDKNSNADCVTIKMNE